MTAGINVVGLGEARHNGHEFFSMKRRLIECLATEHGFTHLVMEDSLPYGDTINLDIPNRPQAHLTPAGYYVASNSSLRYLAIGFSFFAGVEPWNKPADRYPIPVIIGDYLIQTP